MSRQLHPIALNQLSAPKNVGMREDPPIFDWDGWIKNSPEAADRPVSMESLRRSVHVCLTFMALAVVVYFGLKLSGTLGERHPISAENVPKAVTPFASVVRLFKEKTRGCLYSYREQGDYWMVYGHLHPLMERLDPGRRGQVFVLAGRAHQLSVFRFDRSPKSLAEVERDGQRLIARTFRPFVSLWSFEFTTRLYLHVSLIEWGSAGSKKRVWEDLTIENQDFFELFSRQVDPSLSLDGYKVPFRLFDKTDRVKVLTTWSLRGDCPREQWEVFDLREWRTRAACVPPPELQKELEKRRFYKKVQNRLQLLTTAFFLVPACCYLVGRWREIRRPARARAEKWLGIARSV